MTKELNKQMKDAQTVIDCLLGALHSANYEIERLKERIATLEAENPKPKKKERKSLQSFVRTY